MAYGTRSGVNKLLEEQATEMILASLEGETSREAKSDVMTPWKEKHRHTHEIQSRTGAPIDPATRRGIFHRRYNSVQTHLNSYDGPTRPIKMSSNWEDDEENMSYGAGPLSSQMSVVMGVERADD